MSIIPDHCPHPQVRIITSHRSWPTISRDNPTLDTTWLEKQVRLFPEGAYQGLLERSDRVVWLNQQHGTMLHECNTTNDNRCNTTLPMTDGSYTSTHHHTLAILSADCLPIVLYDPVRHSLCSLHGGWRGLANGIISAAIMAWNPPNPETLYVWLGPCICQACYEVGDAVADAFREAHPAGHEAVSPIAGKPNHYHACLRTLAHLQLRDHGISDIETCDICTYEDTKRCYSFRRNHCTARHATLAYLEEL